MKDSTRAALAVVVASVCVAWLAQPAAASPTVRNTAVAVTNNDLDSLVSTYFADGPNTMRPLVVTQFTLTTDWVPWLLQRVLELEAYGLMDNALFIAADEGAVDACKVLRLVCYSPPGQLTLEESRAERAFMERAYLRIMWFKQPVLARLVSLQFPVLFSDLDIVWTLHPLESIQREIAIAAQTPSRAQPMPRASVLDAFAWTEAPTINGGMFWFPRKVPSSPDRRETIRLLEQWGAVGKDDPSKFDQAELAALPRPGSWWTLDKGEGCEVSLCGTPALAVPVCAIHANCLGSMAEKVAQMSYAGFASFIRVPTLDATKWPGCDASANRPLEFLICAHASSRTRASALANASKLALRSASGNTLVCALVVCATLMGAVWRCLLPRCRRTRAPATIL